MSIDSIAAFKEKYGIASDELWEVRPGTFAVKHKALERVAAEEQISVKSLTVVAFDPVAKSAALLAVLKKDNREIITSGEASPSNNRNAYPLAMAEKRAIDRGILKLLLTHGDLYSEYEADEFSDAGERSPPGEDAIEKGYHHVISLYCKDRESATEFYKNNKGMINQFRKHVKDRVLEQLRIISEKEKAA